MAASEALATIRRLIRRHSSSIRRGSAVPGLALLHAQAPTAPVETIFRPSLRVVAQGRSQIALGARKLSCDEASYLITTVDVPVCTWISEATPEQPLLGIALDLDAAALTDATAAVPSIPCAATPQPGLVRGRMFPELLEALARLLAFLDRPLATAALTSGAKREVHERLLLGERADILHGIATPTSRLAQIRTATDWLRSHYAEGFSVAGLANMAGMNVPSFHRHFKAVTEMSPLQYRTRIRLQEARRLLLDAGTADTVGRRVGYGSKSHFIRDYRKLFGVPPAADAARMHHAASS